MSTARSVSLVLCDAAGELLGTLPAFTVEDPWWQEVESVVTTARERFTAEVFILRLLDVTSDADNGGHVTYLADLVTKPMRELPLKPAGDAGEEEPLRQPWARPRGVSTTIAWADGALAQIGRTRVGPGVQIKTWNLSSVLRLPTADGGAATPDGPRRRVVQERAAVPHTRGQHHRARRRGRACARPTAACLGPGAPNRLARRRLRRGRLERT